MRIRQAPSTFRIFTAVFISLIAFTFDVHGASASVEKRDAQAWLNKIQAAARHLSYSGTFVYQQANQVRTSRITHILDGKTEVEKLELLDGKPREFIRRNDEMICYLPEAKTVLIEKRMANDVFPALLASNATALANYYNVKKSGQGRIAGHLSQAILLDPKDNLRYGYKLWADKATGLLLRAQTLNEKGEMVEQISFSSIKIGRINRRSVRPSITNTNGWQVENAVMHQVDLSRWHIRAVPPGFKKIREIKRLITDSRVQDASKVNSTAPSQREVSQIVYSDGLAAISIFIEPSTMLRAEGAMQQGATNIVGKRHGDYWLTIVGEVPSAAIKQVANSIELIPK